MFLELPNTKPRKLELQIQGVDVSSLQHCLTLSTDIALNKKGKILFNLKRLGGGCSVLLTAEIVVPR